ncbi:MAG TPA: HmuY family protein [Longimicrobiales bacterium]
MRMHARNRGPAVLIAAIFGAAAVLVALSLQRPEPRTFTPTIPAPAEVGAAHIGPAVYTIDASSPDEWRFFDFSRNSVVESPGAMDWDLAFRRFHIIANGGVGFAGSGGIADLGAIRLDDVGELPVTGYAPTVVRSDSTNPGIGKWYDYGFTSHLLTPKPRTYAVRTADGRYAIFSILSYYCEGPRPGCITIRYEYRGDGGREF